MLFRSPAAVIRNLAAILPRTYSPHPWDSFRCFRIDRLDNCVRNCAPNHFRIQHTWKFHIVCITDKPSGFQLSVVKRRPKANFTVFIQILILHVPGFLSTASLITESPEQSSHIPYTCKYCSTALFGFRFHPDLDSCPITP